MVENNMRMKILLIEDNPGDARLIQEYLNEVSDISFELTKADRLEVGLKSLQEGSFDIVLTDMGLPDSHGIETVTQLINQVTRIPIIVLTGLNDQSVGVEAVKCGAQDYLVKSNVDGEMLNRSMKYAIERKKMADELKRYTEHLEEEVKQRTNELLQSEKMASLGQLVAGVAHEVNNPLAYLNSNTEIIEEQLKELKNNISEQSTIEMLDSINELLDINLKGIERIATITRSLKRFAKPNEGEKAPGDINQGLKDTLLILHNKLKHKVKVHEELGDIPMTVCDIGMVNQVFMNLILNASQAMDEGDIWIKTWNNAENIYISIKDNGFGIPDENQTRIFDPFFTTKKEGTGLGLGMCYRIINDHKGDIKVESQVDVGTTFTVRIPILNEPIEKEQEYINEEEE
jgi:signal transduction histidine kinase